MSTDSKVETRNNCGMIMLIRPDRGNAREKCFTLKIAGPASALANISAIFVANIWASGVANI